MFDNPLGPGGAGRGGNRGYHEVGKVSGDNGIGGEWPFPKAQSKGRLGEGGTGVITFGLLTP